MNAHTPVLLNQAIEALAIRPDGHYLDATFGRGGHSRAILSHLNGGSLVVMDKDPDAIANARELALKHPNLEVIQSDFAQLGDWLTAHDIKLNGALFDLGVSSAQLDAPERGFSFSKNGPLDMRMDNDRGETAAEWINRVEERELARVLRDYGEEKFALRIAAAICRERPLHTTGELATIIAAAQPKRDPHKHPATRSFQAIRIAVNRELDSLGHALEALKRVMLTGARLVVIAFHSLEDRLVKRFINANSGEQYPPSVPSMKWRTPPLLRAVTRCFADKDEQQSNPRARSAVMRVAEFVQ